MRLEVRPDDEIRPANRYLSKARRRKPERIDAKKLNFDIGASSVVAD